MLTYYSGGACHACGGSGCILPITYSVYVLKSALANMFGAFPPLAAQNNARELVRPTPRGGRHGGLPAQVRALTDE